MHVRLRQLPSSHGCSVFDNIHICLNGDLKELGQNIAQGSKKEVYFICYCVGKL